MDIVAATADFEAWLGRAVDLCQTDLDYKHKVMADRRKPFQFFRGTYYRWATHWPTVCPELVDAPRVLAVGDLHVENYGTWRDPDGRLCWGVNDFDEAAELSYANDLVRLAASVRFARKAGALNVKLGPACQTILRGYRRAIQGGGKPFVLEERHPQLRAMAMTTERDPVGFWKEMTKLLDDPPVEPPPAARDALLRDLPAAADPALRFRPKVGAGSLGKPRFVALAEWTGGWICREAKAVTAPATAWVAGGDPVGPSRMVEAVGRAVRCHDPYYRPGPQWVGRRLAPRSCRIELNQLAPADLGRVLRGMGAECANVHLGMPGAADAVLRDLDARPADWLATAARAMADALTRDWKDWRNRPSEPGA